MYRFNDRGGAAAGGASGRAKKTANKPLQLTDCAGS